MNDLLMDIEISLIKKTDRLKKERILTLLFIIVTVPLTIEVKNIWIFITILGIIKFNNIENCIKETNNIKELIQFYRCKNNDE